MSKGDVLVKETMKMNPITIKTEASVREAAVLMKKKSIGSLIVEDETPVGIITESDILKKVVAKDLLASEVLVKDIMSTPIIVADPYISVEEALKTMSKCNIRRLPVVEKNKLIGIITQKDISLISPILHEISREWYDISKVDKEYMEGRVYSGKCEDCGTLSTNLRNIDGRLVCEDCKDALEYE